MATSEQIQAEKEIKARIKAEHPEAVFLTIPRIGLAAFGCPDFDDFLMFMSDNMSRSSDKILVREQLAIDALVYPDAPDSKKKVRSVLRAMPMLLSNRIGGESGDLLHELIEECARKGEVKPLQLTEDERTELDKKHEFGVDGIWTAETGNIIVTTDESKAPFVRVVLNEAANARKDMGKKMIAAILASLVTPEREEVETVLCVRPGLITPLWIALTNLTGGSEVEISKN